MLYLRTSYRRLKHIIVIPLIFFLIIPLAITDLFVEIYHRLCFPLCKMPYVKRDNYIKIDRLKLKYLTIGQKVGCTYCGYANGVVSYWVQIAGASERYWCGIAHQKKDDFNPPAHHEEFTEYGDEGGFKEKYEKK